MLSTAINFQFSHCRPIQLVKYCGIWTRVRCRVLFSPTELLGKSLIYSHSHRRTQDFTMEWVRVMGEAEKGV